MTYEQFLKEVPSYLAGRFPADTQIHIRSVLKNNDSQKDGLVISETGNTISPTIYLNGFYRRMEEEGDSFEQVMDDVLMLYRNNRPAKDLDVDFFSDYEQVKSKVVYKLVSKQQNAKLLEDVPHMEVLDLAVVFLCLFPSAEHNYSTVLIHNEHCKLWKVNGEALWEQAKVNTPRLLPYVLQPMDDVLTELMQVDLTDEMSMQMGLHPMYVLSNQARMHGASAILYPHMLQEFANCMQSDFYIIPSSIHELILIPTGERNDDARLNELIAYVNAEELQPEDILSDHVYYFSREREEILFDLV